MGRHMRHSFYGGYKLGRFDSQMIQVKIPGTRKIFGLKISHKRYPRPLVDTFHYLKYKYPKCTWGEMSLRKQVCLLYLQWMMFPEKEHRSELIEKVKEWRIKEPNRIGGKRSVLEKLCRKFYAEHRKEKMMEKQRDICVKTGKEAFKNKTGIHSPEVREKLLDPELLKKKQERAILANSLHWWVYSPDGEVFEIHNLKAFCREKGLDDAHLCRTAKYPGKTHKGWSARKRNVDLEGFTPGSLT